MFKKYFNNNSKQKNSINDLIDNLILSKSAQFTIQVYFCKSNLSPAEMCFKAVGFKWVAHCDDGDG